MKGDWGPPSRRGPTQNERVACDTAPTSMIMVAPHGIRNDAGASCLVPTLLALRCGGLLIRRPMAQPSLGAHVVE